jgi:prolyl-tRNA editing enzyme YbaK/EbsC (Cys-tRNA(Pro) deacylase)
MHPNATAVAAALALAGATGEVRELADSARTAAQAAAALGCTVGAIANSLVFMADEHPVLILTSGAHRVDTAHVAGQLGVGAVRRATPEQVRAATGQPIGGVAPVGHPRPSAPWWTRRCRPTRWSGPRAARRTRCFRPATPNCCGSAPGSRSPSPPQISDRASVTADAGRPARCRPSGERGSAGRDRVRGWTPVTSLLTPSSWRL